MSKHRGRFRALQTLYGLSFTPAENEEQLAALFLSSTQTGKDDEDKQTREFAWELIKTVWQHSNEIDALLARYSRNRPLSRVGRLERILLNLALCEMIYLKTEPPVIKKESAALAKEFGLQESRNYVTGILDAAARDLAAFPPHSAD